MTRALLQGAGITLLIAALPPTIEQTVLYTKVTHGCRTLPLTTWSHSTRSVLRENNVTLDAVQLCNDDKYPIFTVHFPYDPRGLTTGWFHRLYARMAQANGNWPFSFVDISDDVIVNVAIDKNQNLDISYEDFIQSASFGVSAGNPK